MSAKFPSNENSDSVCSPITLCHIRCLVFGSVACGGYIELGDNDPPGYITSPNYPQNYAQNSDCVWVIAVPNGESVRIDFEEDFYIEPTSRYGPLRVKRCRRPDCIPTTLMSGSHPLVIFDN